MSAASPQASKPTISKLERALELLDYLRKTPRSWLPPDLHDLLRCHENIQRLYQAEAHVRTILFREETRWPGYYLRNDIPDNWMRRTGKCSSIATYKNGQWEIKKVPVIGNS